MAFPDNPNRLEAVFVQRDTNNTRYDQINISGSDLIVYLDENGKINADKVSTFASKYNIGTGPTGSAATSSWATSSIYAISASWASSSVFSSTASFATRSLTSISSSWASSSISSSYAATASQAIVSISASYFSGSQITASSILVGLILPSSSSVGSPSQPFSAMYATNFFGSASFSTQSLSSSFSSQAASAVSASNALTASVLLGSIESATFSVSSSWASSSLSSSVAGISQTASYVNASSVSGTVSSASYALTASFALNGGGGGSGSIALTASVGMLALDTNLWGTFPYFVSSGHMSASNLTSTADGTIKAYASALASPPLQKVFYIGRDGNVNTWAALGFYNDAGGDNAKYWLNYADNANLLQFAAANDDFSLISPWLTVTRSGSAITQILFQRSITTNGNVLPQASLSHSLGTSSLQWRTAWIQNVIGTSSVALNALTASTINFVPSTAVSASWASMSISASYAPSTPSISASYSATSSYAYNAGTASILLGSVESSTFALSASWASQSLSSSVAISATSATTSITSSHALSALRTISASWASQSLSASYVPASNISGVVPSASYAINAGNAYAINFVPPVAISASWASQSLSSISADTATNANNATSASHALQAVSSLTAISASYAPQSGTITNAETASIAFTASIATSSSYANSSSQAINALTASLLIGNVENATQAVSASWASSSLSSSHSENANSAISASVAITASYLLGLVDSSNFSISSSWASASLSSSVALTAITATQATTASFATSSLTSSYPWAVSNGNPHHNTKPVGIGTTIPVASRLSILEPITNSISQSIVTIYGHRTDLTTMSLEIRNLSATSSNSMAALRLGLGLGLEGGQVFVSRTATPSYGIVKGINISTTAGDGDIGLRAGLALSGSVAGPHVQIKSDGTIGMGVASPVNARLHIGGTDLPFYNATLRMTNGSAGGADVFFAATDDAWGGSVTGKVLIGTGDPSSGTQILQLYPPSASVGIGIASNVVPQAKLHVQGNISASSVTASLYGTASWSENTITSSYARSSTSSSYALSASILLGSVESSTFAVSASWASSSLSASYAATSSVALTVNTASYAVQSLSASYAPSAPSISASYALTASFSLNAGGSSVSSRAMVLCAALTPYLTGPDAAEIPVPYDTNGTTPLSWSVNRLNLRVQLSGSTTSSVSIEKSSSPGAFVSDVTLGTLILNSSSYQTFTGSLANVVSGDKIRFNVNTIGTAQYWTITTEISSL